MQKIGFVWENGHSKSYLAELFLKNETVSDDRTLFPQWVRTLPQPWDKKVSLRKLFDGRRINSYTARERFNVCQNDYHLAENVDFLARSNFNSSANFGQLMTNDGALES